MADRRSGHVAHVGDHGPWADVGQRRDPPAARERERRDLRADLKAGSESPIFKGQQMSQTILSEQGMREEPRTVPAWPKEFLASLLANLVEVGRLLRMSPDEIEAQIKSDPEYEEAETFQENIEPTKEADYTWVWRYSEDTFKRVETIYKELDDKANDIVKYLGGGTGLFTLGVLANVSHSNYWIIICALPAFLLALTSIALALRARQPNPACQPPSIRSAYKFADHYIDVKLAQATFLGEWHLACTGMVLANRAKAVRIRYATFCFWLSIASLGLPIIAAIRSS
jgi:hypothetical protein